MAFFPGNPKAVIDIIPAYLVANSIIVAGAEALSSAPAHRIYQCSSSHCNPITIREVINHVVEEASDNHQQHGNLFLRKPARPFMMVPGWVFNLGIRLGYNALGFSHSLQSIMGRTPSAYKLTKLDTSMKLAVVFSFYTRPRYRFSNSRLHELYQRLEPSEQPLFKMDARQLDWKHYIRSIHIPGLNRYALKPRSKDISRVKPETQPATA